MARRNSMSVAQALATLAQAGIQLPMVQPQRATRKASRAKAPRKAATPRAVRQAAPTQQVFLLGGVPHVLQGQTLVPQHQIAQAQPVEPSRADWTHYQPGNPCPTCGAAYEGQFWHYDQEKASKGVSMHVFACKRPNGLPKHYKNVYGTPMR